ncbi:alpha beta-hydrolase [Roridomyces roridus]|uniref:Alpha beta-hydrolase n=1 Tax=Roridomyces roridus TaxID=1738132 RepID=A0AAD7CB93_9AGAR|nr:alpha beta-hydrolase [Roridomyces roridus]
MLRRAGTVLIALGGLYGLCVIGLLTSPYIQTHVLFCHAIRLPWFATYDVPEAYGLAPGKTINLRIETPDNESLGAWFVLADPFYHSLPTTVADPAAYIGTALNAHPTILFFHGNAATRAFSARIQHYKAFSSRLGANVLALDYRGFGDSTGAPDEPGLGRDARAAWNWLIQNGASADQILIVGHSLGTGVSALLAAELSDEGISPRGLVLLSPFRSVFKILETYSILGVLPLMRPIVTNPFAAKLVKPYLLHTFDTESRVPRIKGQVLIAHSEDDWEIPYTHGEALFNTFLEPLLPSPPTEFSAVLTQEQQAIFNSTVAKRQEAREKLLTTVDLHNFGSVREFMDGERKVVFVKSLAGGHDYLGVQEGVQDVIGRNFGLL